VTDTTFNRGVSAHHADVVAQALDPGEAGYLIRRRWAHTLLLAERQATAIRTNAPTSLPELLHTESYARALMHKAGTSDTAADTAMAQLTERQRGLHDHSTAREYLVHESSLRSAIATPGIMCEQLVHLLHSSGRPSTQVRVIPTSRGPHAAMIEAFTLLDFANHPPVAHVRTTTASLFIEHPDDVHTYQQHWNHLFADALDARDSTQVISSLASTHADAARAKASGHNNPNLNPTLPSGAAHLGWLPETFGQLQHWVAPGTPIRPDCFGDPVLVTTVCRTTALAERAIRGGPEEWGHWPHCPTCQRWLKQRRDYPTTDASEQPEPPASG
jgi:Domain of unknown function (DUF5753)